MGGGTWSGAVYASSTARKVSSGTSFGYDTYAKSSGDYKAHETLDPKKVNSAGLNIRESRDSVEHPLSTPIVVAFDSTGSMGSVPRTAQQKLKTLFNLLVDKNYATDPQVMVATYGDAAVDSVPLQVAQFESDNRVDDNLDNMFLEGGGGGNFGETSNLLMYYLATHTALDSLEKRGKKGYLFVIADERQIPITDSHVKKFIGDDQPLIPLDFNAVAEAVSEKFIVRILLINNSSALYQKSEEFYTQLFGPEAVVIIEDPSTISETIGAMVGFEEGVDRASIDSDLTAAAGKEVALRVGKALDRNSKSTKKAALR